MTTTAEDFWNHVQTDSLTILDIRPGHAYSQGHPPKAMAAPYVRTGWAPAVKRWADQQQASLALFSDNKILANAAVKALEEVGVSVSAVWNQGLEAWKSAGLPVVAVPDITVDNLAAKLADFTVIDVREPYEWRSGTIPGALKVPMNDLPGKMSTLDKSRPYALVCATGNRSQSAAAYLAEEGFQAYNVLGGMSLWLGARHPVER